MQLGLVGVVLITIAVVAMIGLVVLVLRVTVFGGQRDYFRQRTPLLDDEPIDGGRIDIVETRDIDGRRKLVLVRCDDVEHLIVVGGPADLVVENDVKKARTQSPAPRAPAPPPVQTSQPAATQQVSPAMGASLDAAVAGAVPRSAEAPRPAAPEPRAAKPQRDIVTAVAPRAAGRNGEAPRHVAPTPSAGPTRVTIQHPPPGDQQRRAAPTAHIRVNPQPPLAVAPAPAPRPQPERPTQVRAEKQPRPEKQARAERTNNVRNGGAPVGLPSAQVPWVELDTIEAEIVQALRLDGPRRAEAAEPQSAGATQSTREPEPAKHAMESSATLGDLADRLEEALAREMQSVGPKSPKRAEASAAAAAGLEKSVDNAGAKRLVGRDMPERKPEPAQQPAVSAAPEPPQPPAPRETAQSDRREEAPVISLNARRREAADPLEDEMARLLGELTGDKGR